MEERTLLFAKEVRQFIRLLPKTVGNKEDVSQLVRSSGSVGANYIEARERLGKKDAVMRLRIARKEAKEARYWLELIETSEETETQRNALVNEATELLHILSSMIKKSE
jgi:four helix bundle protein